MYIKLNHIEIILIYIERERVSFFFQIASQLVSEWLSNQSSLELFFYCINNFIHLLIIFVSV